MSKCRKLTVPDIDFTDDINAAMTNKLHAAFIPVFATQISNQIYAIDINSLPIHAMSIMDGNTCFSVDAMHAYSHKWDDTEIASPLSHVLISHVSQDSIDVMVKKLADSVVIECVEV